MPGQVREPSTAAGTFGAVVGKPRNVVLGFFDLGKRYLGLRKVRILSGDDFRVFGMSISVA